MSVSEKQYLDMTLIDAQPFILDQKMYTNSQNIVEFNTTSVLDTQRFKKGMTILKLATFVFFGLRTSVLL